MECIFCKEIGKQNIKQLSEERLSPVKSVNECRQFLWYHRTVETIPSYRNCISTYTSKTYIYRYLKKRWQDGKNEILDFKKSRQSTETAFDFRTYCLFCGKRCQEKDPKHPDRWQKYYIVWSVYMAIWIPFKDFILNTCSLRNDELYHDVRFSLSSAISDLHAADARLY